MATHRFYRPETQVRFLPWRMGAKKPLVREQSHEGLLVGGRVVRLFCSERQNHPPWDADHVIICPDADILPVDTNGILDQLGKL